MSKQLFIVALILSFTSYQAQEAASAANTKPKDELNCYNKWAAKFEERGAEEVKDGVYTDVIISVRYKGNATCYSGKVEVIEGKINKFYILLEDGTYEEFKKMDLRVAKVLAAERVPGTSKLLKLQIDLGSEKRQIVAGVAETYSPEELVGKEFIVIANLQPAVIRGVESQGMLLAAEVEGKAIIPFFDRELPPGTKVK